MNVLKNKKRLTIIALAVIIIAVLLIVAVYKIINVTVVWDGDEPFDMSDIKSYQKIHLVMPEGIAINPSRVVFQGNTQIVSVEFLGDSQDLLIAGFSKCTSLKSVKIHTTGNVTVNDSAFRGCTALKKVEFPSEKKYKKLEIGSSAFYGCSALTEINLYSYADLTIEERCFYECTSLKNMILPSSYDTINDLTFYGCTALESVIYPDGTPTLTIRTQAFKNCTSLKEFDFPDDSSFSLSDFSECALFDTEDGITYINKFCAVGSDDSLTRLTFRNGTTAIAGYASWGENIEYLELSSQIKNIGECAFGSCHNLKEVVCNAKCDIPTYCFIGCENLEKVDMSYSSASKIGYMAFDGCSSLRQVILPQEHLIKIGIGAFQDCIALEDINFDKCSLLVEIGLWAFIGCTSLKKADLGNTRLNGVASSIFQNCTSLEEVTLPKTIDGIAMNAFENCTSLETVTLEPENDCRLIYENAFRNCSSLKNVYNLRNDVSISENAFSGCDLFKTDGN